MIWFSWWKFFWYFYHYFGRIIFRWLFFYFFYRNQIFEWCLIWNLNITDVGTFRKLACKSWLSTSKWNNNLLFCLLLIWHTIISHNYLWFQQIKIIIFNWRKQCKNRWKRTYFRNIKFLILIYINQALTRHSLAYSTIRTWALLLALSVIGS